MKYAFVRITCKETGVSRFVDLISYNWFELNLKDYADQLVVMDNIYIGCFKLFETINSIMDYNPDAVITTQLSLTDIMFNNNSVYEVANVLECDNVPEDYS